MAKTDSQESGSLSVVEKIPILRIERTGSSQILQDVIQEAPATLFVNGKEIVTLLTVPRELDALAVGFLFSEGWLTDRSALEEIRVEEAGGVVRVRLRRVPALTERFLEKRLIASSCGKATSFYNIVDSALCRPVASDFRATSGSILRWIKEMLQAARLYRTTRATHSVALYGDAGRILLEEDIGRHNAVDRVLGKCLLKGIAVEQTALLATGRLSSEIVIKAARLGAPIVVSRSAPTALAIRLGERLGLTLVGYVRGGTMNVYAHARRIREGP
ncbi:MAG: formate dehydrogenase accessory sulfurtransferase FdhD [bacterium]